MTAPALEARGFVKSFGGAQALRGVDLTVMPGQVHGLLGENGSGKSTLIKILAGYHVPDAGSLTVYGQPVPFPMEPGQFRSLGFDFVHQDLGLIPSLSVLENLRIGSIVSPRRRFRISWAAERRAAAAALARYGVDLPLSRTVSALAPVDRALLAIIRAIEGLREHREHAVLVLDEPTVYLPATETSRLFSLLRSIVAEGASVLFVSHNLDEVVEVTDRVTVLRDGLAVGTVSTPEISKRDLVSMIVGRELEEFTADHASREDRPVRAAVRGLTGRRVRGVDFEIRRGEILGLTGLVGAAFEEVPYLLFGAVPGTGELRTDAVTHAVRDLDPVMARSLGLALIPADRQRDGSVASLSAMDNITIPVVERYFSGLRLRRSRMARESADLMREFDVRPPEPGMRYGSFSGGNQQKVLLAKWLQLRPDILLLHEPTQGVDVGARAQIYEQLRAARDEGTSIVCASSDAEELALLADRVLVFSNHEITSQIEGADLTKERIAHMSYAAPAAGRVN